MQVYEHPLLKKADELKIAIADRWLDCPPGHWNPACMNMLFGCRDLVTGSDHKTGRDARSWIFGFSLSIWINSMKSKLCQFRRIHRIVRSRIPIHGSRDLMRSPSFHHRESCL
jgi:hypothetical protein